VLRYLKILMFWTELLRIKIPFHLDTATLLRMLLYMEPLLYIEMLLLRAQMLWYMEVLLYMEYCCTWKCC
jgi:hypothetical protein